ncbi:MAG TPA: hypothetical protein VGG64_13570 [Pirellulales bacterium]|jgi:hypothetical protein
MVIATTNCLTLGYLAQLLQAAPARIRAAADAAGVRPVLVINEKAHYAECDLDKLRAALGSEK